MGPGLQLVHRILYLRLTQSMARAPETLSGMFQQDTLLLRCGTALWNGWSAFSGSALPAPLCSEKSVLLRANPTCLSFLLTSPQSPWAFHDMSFPTFPTAFFSGLSQGTVSHGLDDHSPPRSFKPSDP